MVWYSYGCGFLFIFLLCLLPVVGGRGQKEASCFNHITIIYQQKPVSQFSPGQFGIILLLALSRLTFYTTKYIIYQDMNNEHRSEFLTPVERCCFWVFTVSPNLLSYLKIHLTMNKTYLYMFNTISPKHFVFFI